MRSLKNKAYEIIRDNIISCRYAPGEFLTEARLIEETSTSRTPIREALSKLEQERLVRILPKKGVMVSDLSLKEINDIYQVRLLLEPQIILHWGDRIPREELETCRRKILDYNSEMGLEERVILGDSLHRMIIGACPNAYIQDWLDYIYYQNHRIRISTGQVGQHMELNNAGHLKILEVLILGEYEKAAAMMTEHLEEARKATFHTLMEEYDMMLGERP